VNYQEHIAQHLRITVLRLLNEQGDYALNESVLMDLVTPFGFAPSRDNLRAQLAWLSEQGLVELSGLEHCQVATLTSRGDDVANGRATVPGVKRPRPGERN
jgi:hypothetical protein